MNMIEQPIHAFSRRDQGVKEGGWGNSKRKKGKGRGKAREITKKTRNERNRGRLKEERR